MKSVVASSFGLNAGGCERCGLVFLPKSCAGTVKRMELSRRWVEYLFA